MTWCLVYRSSHLQSSMSDWACLCSTAVVMLSKDNSLKLKFLRDILKLEQSTLAFGLFYIGFIFYRRKQFVKTRTLKLSHFYYFFFFLKVRLFVWANTKGAISAQIEGPAGLMSLLQQWLVLRKELKETECEWICLILVSGGQHFESLTMGFVVKLWK